MAPLPADNSDRLFVDYRVGGVDQHTMMFRFEGGTIVEDNIAKVHDVLSDLSNAFWSDTTFNACRYAVRGDPNSFPHGWALITGTASLAGRPADYRARFLSFVGRSIDGVNWHSSMFGVTLIPDSNFIIADTEAPTLASVRDALLADPNPVVSISEQVVIPLNYMTTRVSAYWQRRIARHG